MMRKDNNEGVKHDINTIYRKYAPELYKICLRYTSSAQEAEDVLHDGFIRIMDKIEQYQGKGSFEGWLKRIMVNVALNNLRVSKNAPSHHDRFDDINESNVLEDSDGNLNEDRELLLDASFNQDEIVEAMQELPAKARAVFNLYVFDNKKHKEISKLLDVSVNTSKTQLQRARKLLHSELVNKAKMKLNKKKLWVLPAFFTAKKGAEIDELVTSSFNSGTITPPMLDISKIPADLGGKQIAGSMIKQSVIKTVVQQTLSHVQSHVISYGIGTIATATTIVVATSDFTATERLQDLNTLEQKSIELFNQDSFNIETGSQIEKLKEKDYYLTFPKENDIEKTDTITIYKRVR